MRLLLSLIMLNTLSFIVARIIWWLRDDLSAKIIMPRKKLQSEDEKEIIFLAAGNLAQPEKAFEFLRPVFERKPYAFLQFKMIGWDSRATAKAIIDESIKSGKNVTLWTISVGDHVGRYLEGYFFGQQEFKRGGTRIYAVNPCPTRRALRAGLRGLLMIAAPILWVIAHLLGWLSIVPFIPATGGKYSLILLADQYMGIAYDMCPKNTSQTQGIILSTQDELLDNEFLEKGYFTCIKIVYVSTRHGDTVGMSHEYLRGAKELLEEP